MIFPLGEEIIVGLGLFVLLLGRSGSSTYRFCVGLWLAWFVGRLLETFYPDQGLWHWHYSRIFVLLFFAVLAWQETDGRKIWPAIITAFALTGQNLFVINEPGMFHGDQWFFAGIVFMIAYLTTQDGWGMGLALAGGILLNLGISVFLFAGIVRHYDLPDPFYWNLSMALLAAMSAWRYLGEEPIIIPENQKKE